MMNGGMPASGGGGHMGQMGGQMGMNPMVMGRMQMGPDQVGGQVHMFILKQNRHAHTYTERTAAGRTATVQSEKNIKEMSLGEKMSSMFTEERKTSDLCREMRSPSPLSN